MKLFKVRIAFETVILADNQQAAEQRAERVIRESDDTAESVSAEELVNPVQLSSPWTPDCRPWGERDPFDRSIGEILKAQAEDRSAQATH